MQGPEAALIRWIEERRKKLAADTIGQPTDTLVKYHAQCARHDELGLVLGAAKKIFYGDEEGG